VAIPTISPSPRGECKNGTIRCQKIAPENVPAAVRRIENRQEKDLWKDHNILGKNQKQLQLNVDAIPL